MENTPMERLHNYIQLLRDTNCLKVIYYLYRFNPDVPIKDLSKNLSILEDDVIKCLYKLAEANVIIKSNDNAGYSLTTFGRTAFKDLLTSRPQTPDLDR